MKIYTKTGDRGQTSLLGGKRVDKSHAALEAYGTTDELNSVIGIVISNLGILRSQSNLEAYAEEVSGWLVDLQRHLFILGSHLACEDEKIRARLPEVPESFVHWMEATIDHCETQLEPLSNFILPGGSRTASFLHFARTICRRAERLTVDLSEKNKMAATVVTHLNRMSDLLFVLARYANKKEGHKDQIWAGTAQS